MAPSTDPQWSELLRRFDLASIPQVGFPGGSSGREPARNLLSVQEMQDMRVQFLGQEDPLK